MDILPLPAPPDFLASQVAESVRADLQTLYTRSSETFAKVFGSRQGSAAPMWRAKTPAEVQRLLEIGLLKESEEKVLHCDYLVTQWDVGVFYLTDFPDFYHHEEVFAPFPATRFFSTLLQARPGDSVLDLGTGSGILLLEAARRGATGLGIDSSARALAFARTNAVLNGLEAQVRFERGDMTQPPIGDPWGTPTLVLSNPPCTPVPDDPGVLPLPLHSDGGPYGDTVITKMLEVLAQWSHRPALVQLVLLALGRAGPRSGQHILRRGGLENAVRVLGGTLDLRELLRPIQLQDFLALTLQQGPHAAQKWHVRMQEEGFQTLHLLSANMYLPTPRVSTSAQSVRWVPYANSHQNDECFLWALASPRRTLSNRHKVEAADISEQYLTALITVREEEEKIVGQAVDLRLDDERVHNYIARLLQDGTLFNGHKPLVLLDLRRVSVGESPLRGVVILDEKGATFKRYSLDELRSYIETEKRFNKGIGITICDVLTPPAARDQEVEADKPPYYKCCTDVGDPSQVLLAVEKLPEGVVQRLAVISIPNACLPPIRRPFYANFLSELAGVTSRVKGDSVSEAYSLAHPLKHRLGALRSRLRGIRQNYGKSDITSRIRNAERLVDQLYSFAELLHLLHSALTQGPEKTLCVEAWGEFRFSTEGVLEDLTTMIGFVADSCLPSQNDQITLQLPSSFRAAIKPFASVRDGRIVRCKDEIYREILFEVFTNALAHGIGPNRSVLVTVGGTSIEGLDAIVVSNQASDEYVQRRLGEPPLNAWRAWPEESPTGLTFASRVLRITGAGRLFYQHPLRAGGNHRDFSVGLAFSGLALSPLSDKGE